MRQPGETIFINREIRIVDESADWVVVDKPPHLLIHPTAPNGPFTLWDGLREILAYEMANGGQISIINRLDRETSGLVLIAKNVETARTFAGAMQDHLIEKEYLAIVLGHPFWEQLPVSAPLIRQGSICESAIHLRQMAHPSGAPAETHFTVLKRFTGFDSIPLALLRARPLTGRTHQIRVHAALAGFPLLGDKIYGADETCYLDFIAAGWTSTLASRLHHPRHALHSALLSLPALDLKWASPLPRDLAEIVPRETCSLPF